MRGPGFYEISGVAYSGTGRIAKVMVSADGAKSWGEAALQGPVHSKAFTRFRMPWRWDGGPAVLQSRAWDESGNFQPTRSEFVAVRGETRNVPHVMSFPNQHYNSITSWCSHWGGQVCLSGRSFPPRCSRSRSAPAQRSPATREARSPGPEPGTIRLSLAGLIGSLGST
jgi:Mo-co oxidoreductase dimerisation domain